MLALMLPLQAQAESGGEAITATERPFSPDRPSFTGSPYTLDPGRFQFEMTFGSFARDKSQDAGSPPVEVKTIGTGASTLRWGVTEDVELQLGFDGLLIEDTRTALEQHRSTTAGNVSVTAKVNFWGNDSGRSAFGMIPYISLPTSTPASGNRDVVGGVAFPLAVALPGDISLGMQAGIEMDPNEIGGGYGAIINGSVIAGISLTPKVSGYVEIFNVKDTRAGNAWENAAGLGIAYRVTENIQFDTGANVGLSRAAGDLELFIGFAIRL